MTANASAISPPCASGLCLRCVVNHANIGFRFREALIASGLESLGEGQEANGSLYAFNVYAILETVCREIFWSHVMPFQDRPDH